MLKPEDIQSKEFDTKMRGYDKDQVDDFLDTIIEDMVVLYKDNTELSKRVGELSSEISALKAKGTETDKAIELAKYQCAELKKNAQFEAKTIIENAKVESETILHSIENNKVKIKQLCTEMLEKINNM